MRHALKQKNQNRSTTGDCSDAAPTPNKDHPTAGAGGSKHEARGMPTQSPIQSCTRNEFDPIAKRFVDNYLQKRGDTRTQLTQSSD